MYKAVGALLVGLTAVTTIVHATVQAEANTPVVPAPGLVCYEAAIERTFLEEYRARDLCRGANVVGPVECYLASRERTALSERQGIELCRCALTDAPVACFERAEDQTDMLEFQIVEMCNARSLRDIYGYACEDLE